VSCQVVRGKNSRIGGSRMCAFFNFRGVFVIFQSQSHPDRRTKRNETRAFAKQRRRSIAQIFSQQHIEKSTLSFSLESLCKRTQPYLPFFRWGCKETLRRSVATTRRKTGKKSIFQFFFFELFSVVGSRKITPPRLTLARSRALLRKQVSRRRECEWERRLGVSRSRGGGVFFFFRCEEVRVENSFFLFEAWSWVARSGWRRRGFQMAKREGSKEFFTFRVLSGRPFGRRGLHFIYEFLPFFARRVFNVCLFSGVRAYRLFIK